MLRSALLEAILALRIAGAARYLDPETVARDADELDRIVATLYKLAHRAARTAGS